MLDERASSLPVDYMHCRAMSLVSRLDEQITSTTKPQPSTPVPDIADDERMHKFMSDRRVIGVRHF